MQICRNNFLTPIRLLADTGRGGEMMPTMSRGVSARELRAQLGLNRRLFSRLTGYSERAVADWEAGKELSDSTRQRLTEIQRLQRALARVMKSEFVGAWLQAPNPAFEGLKPIEIVERGEIDRLWRMIHRLE